MKYVIWGLGAVGYSFLTKLKENNLFIPTEFFCIDYSEKAKDNFINLGGIESNFIKSKITKDNYKEHLSKLEKGDYLLDFCIDIKNLEILKYCLDNKIHYLNTADSSWNPDPNWISDHQHYLEYVEIKDKYKGNLPTCIIEFGMNPGMVSCFAKKCLQEIIDNDNSLYIKLHRNRLKKLLSQNKYGLVSKMIGVTDIQEVDNDNQITKITYSDDVCYSTWNPWGYYYETVSSPEIAFGDLKRYSGYKEIFDCDEKDLYIGLKKSGFEYEAESFSPQGKAIGHISTHEEVFSIRSFFKYKNYMPTVHFLYSPCDYATTSVKNFKIKLPKKLHYISRDEIVSGGESVGIIIQGKKFKSRYYGNYLETNNLDESATVLQVSASVYSAFFYMKKHPCLGMLFPEELDEKELLIVAKKYLKNYISCTCPKSNITLGK